MDDYLLSPIEIYFKRSIRLLLLLTTLCAVCASGTFTVLKILGFYPTVSLKALILFDVFDIFCFIAGQLLTKKIVPKDGSFNKEPIPRAKALILILILLQWNFITYLIPSRDFWAYSSLFVLLVIFYLDHIYTLLLEIGMAISMYISWLVKGDEFAPVRDAYYLPNFALRVILVILMFAFLWVATFVIQNLLLKPMERISDYDVLTGLRNRRSMYKIINEAIKSSNDEGKTVTVALCDIDNFKNINDTYGHDAGDMVLKEVAETIDAVVSGNGVAFRYGGEEFVILIKAQAETALTFTEIIRKSVEKNTININGQAVNVTITLGAVNSGKSQSVDNLISMADDLMYKGKQSGKNTVVSRI